MHLQASEIDVEPPLQKFIGDQSDAKLRGGPEHSRWKRPTGWGRLNTEMAVPRLPLRDRGRT